MRRRRFIVGMVTISSVLSGCLWIGDSDGSADRSLSQPDGSRPSETNILPVEQNVSVSDGSFTETDRSEPLESETFIRTYEQIVQSNDLQMEWTTNVRGETIEVLYLADDTNHEQRMEVFVDAFIELTYRAGGTDRDMHFVVKRSGEVWYEWELTDDHVREFLHGEITRNELLSTVNETVETPDDSDESRTETELESDPTSDADADDDTRDDVDTDEGETDAGEGSSEDGETDGAEGETDAGEGSSEDGETDSDAVDDDGDADSDSGTGPSGFAVRIQYENEWSGVVGDDERSRSVDGSGTETFAIENEHPFVIAANAQKLDDGSGTLTIQILEDGAVVREASTDAAYGIASVSYTL